MVERTPLIFLIFAGLIFMVFVMMLISVLPHQTVVFTDEEDEISEGIQEYDPVLGDKNAPIVITHYSDFLCESCAETATSLSNIVEDYPDEIAIVWKDFPNVSAHPLAPGASIAARCAGEQGEFWAYHDLLFTYQRDITTETAAEYYMLISEELDLGSWRFNRCVNKQQTFEDLEASYADANALELTASPTITVNDERFSGSMSENEIRSVILNLELTF
ncbi:thioredoxin domain-containing protein [Candidatus Uhrbacteria bacterium]|jgi:protein-disulfide isomerase|nr:thioredoxin domain-containing protein [Candidatus Uhrbacteria bacterium]